MKNILFLVPDSTGIRNYLYSDVIKHLKVDASIAIWSPLPVKVFDNVREFHGVDIQYKKLKLPQENILGRWLRETASFARLKWNAKKVDNSTILTNWNYKPKGGLPKRLFNKTNRWIGSVISNRFDSILNFEKLARNLWSKDIIEYYKGLLKRSSIDKVFITHQRVAHLMPICLAAKNLGIEVITVIYSWDNLPKARLNVEADKYLVWSDYMKEEMATFYPEIPKEKIFVTGTPQFEFYQKKELIIEREIFAQKNGLNPSNKWILYSGSDTLTSPYDQDYLEDLAIALKDQDDIQIIFRRSPADFSERFDAVIQKFEDKIVKIDPVWNIGRDWSSNIPLIDDFEVLANLTFHSELAVNVGSTIAHDFANYDKPAMYINYDQPLSKNWTVKVLNEFQHFRSMPTKDAVIWINNKSEWKESVLGAIQCPDKKAFDRLKWFNSINHMDQIPASEKIAKILSA